MSQALHDMTGQTIDGLTVLRRSGTAMHGQTIWTMVCQHGHEFTRYGSTIRQAKIDGRALRCAVCERARKKTESDEKRNRKSKRCPDCSEVKELREFYPHKSSIDKRQSRCKKCERSRKNQTVVYDSKRPWLVHKANRLCKKCGSLAHRVEGKSCEKCGLRFAEQDAITTADVEGRGHACKLVNPA